MFCLNVESDCILLVVVKMYCIVSTHPPLVSFCCVFTPRSYWISPAHNHGADIELSTSTVYMYHDTVGPNFSTRGCSAASHFSTFFPKGISNSPYKSFSIILHQAKGQKLMCLMFTNNISLNILFNAVVYSNTYIHISGIGCLLSQLNMETFGIYARYHKK